MILIFSRETELSTSNVLLWLKSYKESYIRITEHTKIVIDKLYLANSGYDVNLGAVAICPIFFESKNINTMIFNQLYILKSNCNTTCLTISAKMS